MQASGCGCSATNYRVSYWLDGQGEHITNTTFGLDDARGTRIGLELSAEPEDLHIDAAIEHVLVDPRRLQEVLAAQRSLRRIEERDQQRALARPLSARPGHRRGR